MNLTKAQQDYLQSLSNKSLNLEAMAELVEKDYLFQVSFKENKFWKITKTGEEALGEAKKKTREKVRKDTDTYPDHFIQSLQELFPKGLKEGTQNYWRSTIANIRERLIKFEDKFGYVELGYILDATKKYVASFGEDTRFMRTLDYFIWKRDLVKGEISDLYTWIQNKDNVKNALKPRISANNTEEFW